MAKNKSTAVFLVFFWFLLFLLGYQELVWILLLFFGMVYFSQWSPMLCHKSVAEKNVIGMANVKSIFSYLLFHHISLLIFTPSSECAILKLGTPLSWKESLPYLRYVRRHGVSQFIKKYDKCKDVVSDELLWGDEIEYGIFAFDPAKKTYDLSCRTAEILKELRERESQQPQREEGCTWQPEYGAWMIEGIPNKPYRGFVADLLRLEQNLRLRRGRLHTALNANEIAPSLSNFPLLGAKEHPSPIVTKSRYLPDAVINPHPRFGTLTRNIPARRGSSVSVAIPKLIKTGSHLADSANDDVIRMDSMAFGMGCCCIQITIQSDTEKQSRFIHDQLAVLSPIFMALTVSTPIHRGILANIDARWNVISQAVDDRTAGERGDSSAERQSQLAGEGVRRLSKSRYSTVSTYIGKCLDEQQTEVMKCLNDIVCETDEESYKMLQEAGVDAQLARHIAHLFVRDPLVVFKERIVLDDETQDDHFQSIQSTNWRTVRWKPPDLHPSRLDFAKEDSILIAALAAAAGGDESKSKVVAGWRNEFRAMETQLTDFENAAYSVFLLLLTRALLAFGANLYMPLSKVEVNMERAHALDAIKNCKFIFRNDIFEGALDCPNPRSLEGVVCRQRADQKLEPPSILPSCREMTLDEIINGSANFVGLINIVKAYINALGFDQPKLTRLNDYLTLISKRASGELPTAAKWLRDRVTSHPEYKHDGIASEQIVADLMQECEDIGMGKKPCSSLYGNVKIDAIDPQLSFEIPLSAVLPETSSTLANNEITTTDNSNSTVDIAETTTSMA